MSSAQLPGPVRQGGSGGAKLVIWDAGRESAKAEAASWAPNMGNGRCGTPVFVPLYQQIHDSLLFACPEVSGMCRSIFLIRSGQSPPREAANFIITLQATRIRDEPREQLTSIRSFTFRLPTIKSGILLFSSRLPASVALLLIPLDHTGFEARCQTQGLAYTSIISYYLAISAPSR